MSETKKPILVQKFGGSMLADLNGFEAAVSVIESYAGRYQLVVVLSAVRGVTDQLLRAIDRAEEGSDPSEEARSAISAQKRVLESLSGGPESAPGAGSFLNKAEIRITEWLEGIRLLQQCPPESRAKILATGEGFSSRLLADLLVSRGLDATWSDTDVLPPANDDQLDTLIDIDAASSKLSHRLGSETSILVLPGFYGKGPGGQIQLFGRNGTDYSAAAVAAALQAEKCQIWKDVDGFFSADPGVVLNAVCLSEVSYEEAMELTYFGASVISAKALSPLAAAEIPCEIRNAWHPLRPGTLVHSDATKDGVVRGISHLSEVASITIQGGGLQGRVGIVRRVTESLARNNISILLIVQSSSEFSITLCVREKEVKKAARALREEFHFEQMHGLVEDILVQPDRAMVSIVGDGMKHYRGIAARFLTAISAAGINVEVIAQGSTESAIAVVVEGRDAIAATRACHTSFFSKTTHIDVLLLGCGNVGSELLRQFQSQAGHLLRSHMELRVRAIANSRKLLVTNNAIDLDHWESALRDQGQPWTIEDVINIRERLGLINPTVIDCTTDEGLAGQYVALLRAGFHVVAANKKANTMDMAYYHELRTAAAQNFKKFLYETNVGAGLPVIDNMQALLRSGDRLGTFEGILSGSLSMILGVLDDGETLSEAVEKAISLGFTEPDPRDDLSGMDVARKLLIIAREVGLELELDDIEVEPVVPVDQLPDGGGEGLVTALQAYDQVFRDRADLAKSNNKVLRYVGKIEGEKCRVSIEETPVTAPLGAVRDGENALVLHTRYYAPIPLVLRGYGAGAEVTAAGVFADLLRTAWRPLD